MYKEVILDAAFDSFKMVDAESFDKLSRINVLIGKNNSGKSRFMRTLFSHPNLDFKTKASFTLEYAYDYFKKSVSTIRSNGVYNDISHLVPTLENIKSPIKHGDKTHWKNVGVEIEGVEKALDHINNNRPIAYKQDFSSQTRISMAELREAIQNKVKESYNCIYVPILRGLRPVQSNGDTFDTKEDVYLKRTRKDYFPGNLGDRLIVSGLDLYEETKRLLLGRISDRRKVQAFEKFISETFFEGKEFSIVPHVEDDVIYVRIGSEEKDEKPIYHLGDGIQAIIILTYPLFFHQGESCAIYFEEPETHLHPGLQRLFIETLRRPEFKTFQYFLTTHSNHFLDLTADYDDIAVYSFRKDESDAENETFLIENVEDGEGSVLQELGVRASSVFLSNCTIWVEGITDRLYLRKFLAVYQKSLGKKVFKEDLHYSFVEYGGNNITHWSFLDSDDPEHSNINVDWICRKIFLITDKDGAKEGSRKSKRPELLRQKLGDNYFCLPCREIENILTAETIQKVLVSKEDNPNLDFSRFNRANHKPQKLGDFIDEKVTGLGRKYASKSGTINDKVNFCKVAVENIENVEDLSEDARELCEKLYRFIEKANIS